MPQFRPLSETKFINDANLVAYYKLEDVNDSKGSYTLTNNNTVAFNAAKFGNGADFGTSNTNKYLSVASNLGLTWGGAKTISCWIKLNTEIANGFYNVLDLTIANRSSSFSMRYEYNSGTRRMRFVRYSDVTTAVDTEFTYNITLGTTQYYLLTQTYDGTTFSAYINGALIGSGASSNAGSGTQSYSDGFTIGSFYGGNSYCSAIIDDTAIFSRALSASEVNELYQGMTLGEYLPDVGRYNELQNITLRNDSSLVGYWRLEGNSNDSKNSYNGTDTVISYGTNYGIFGQGASFNGTTSEIRVSSNLYTTSTYATSFWMKCNGHPADGGAYIPSFNAVDFGLGVGSYYANSSGVYGITYVNYLTSGNKTLTYIVDLGVNIWHHILYQTTASGMEMYIDGKLVASNSQAGTLRTSTNHIIFGADEGDTNTLNGYMDDIAIFNRSLSQAEINTIYNGGSTKLLLHLNGNSTDSSGNGNNGTDTAITYSQANGRFGMGAGFNGSTSQINLGTNVTSLNVTNFTIVSWINFTTSQAQSALVSNMIYYSSGGTTYSDGYETYIDANRFALLLGKSNSTYSVTTSLGTTTLNDGTWKCVIATYDGTNIKLYVNGVLQTTTASAAIAYGTAKKTKIGARYQYINSVGSESNIPYNGSMDEPFIENYAWTPQQVAKYYSYAKGRFGII